MNGKLNTAEPSLFDAKPPRIDASRSRRAGPPPRRVHRFRDSLALSETYADADWWLPVYRRAFPRLQSAVSVREDGWAQRGGVDRVLTLSCGRTFTVDEKIRTEEWPDILLEQWSDVAKRAPGWVQKPLACDFIAYAYAPTGLCFLLPVVPLQRAWRQRGREWIGLYGVRRAQNPGYVSTSVPVPRDVLMQAIAAAMMVTNV
jgi:hypothetical protein